MTPKTFTLNNAWAWAIEDSSANQPNTGIIDQQVDATSVREDVFDQFGDSSFIGHVTGQHRNAIDSCGGGAIVGSVYSIASVLQSLGCCVSDAGRCSGHEGYARFGFVHGKSP
jgi:hypothetical protein